MKSLLHKILEKYELRGFVLQLQHEGYKFEIEQLDDNTSVIVRNAARNIKRVTSQGTFDGVEEMLADHRKRLEAGKPHEDHAKELLKLIEALYKREFASNPSNFRRKVYDDRGIKRWIIYQSQKLGDPPTLTVHWHMTRNLFRFVEGWTRVRGLKWLTAEKALDRLGEHEGIAKRLADPSLMKDDDEQ